MLKESLLQQSCCLLFTGMVSFTKEIVNRISGHEMSLKTLDVTTVILESAAKLVPAKAHRLYVVRNSFKRQENYPKKVWNKSVKGSILSSLSVRDQGKWAWCPTSSTCIGQELSRLPVSGKLGLVLEGIYGTKRYWVKRLSSSTSWK